MKQIKKIYRTHFIKQNKTKHNNEKNSDMMMMTRRPSLTVRTCMFMISLCILKLGDAHGLATMGHGLRPITIHRGNKTTTLQRVSTEHHYGNETAAAPVAVTVDSDAHNLSAVRGVKAVIFFMLITAVAIVASFCCGKCCKPFPPSEDQKGGEVAGEAIVIAVKEPTGRGRGKEVAIA